MPNESGNSQKSKASTRPGKGTNTSTSASVSGSIDGRKRHNKSEPPSKGPPSKMAKIVLEKDLQKKQALKDSKKNSLPSLLNQTASNGNAKSAANTTVIEAVVHAPASTAITPAEAAGKSNPPASSAVTTQSTITNQNPNQANTSPNFTQLPSIIPTDSTTTYNLFLQALNTVLQSPGTLSARAEDTTGSRGKASSQTLPNLETSRALPVRAGDTTGPRSSAPCTVSRAPDSPERDISPTRAGDRKSRSRTRDSTAPRCRESADIGGRAYHPAASIHLTERSDDEYSYHRPIIASRDKNWADDGSSTHLSLPDSDSIRSENIGSLISTQSTTLPDKEPKAQKDGILAAELLIKYCPQLKADSTSSDGKIDAKPIFCLDSELKSHSEGQSAVKLDTPFSACYNKVAENSQRLRAVRRDSQSGYRFDSGDFENVFSTPRIPKAAFRVGDARARKVNFNAMRSSSFKKSDNDLSLIDKSARTSMRLAVYQSYLITALRESERLAIGEEDQRKISDLLLRTSDAQFDQAARTALLCTKQRRAHVLEQLKLEKEAESVLHNLPLSGSDLFSSKLQSVLDENISESSTADKTVYKLTKHDRPSYQATSDAQFRPRPFRDTRPSRHYPFHKRETGQYSQTSFSAHREDRRESSGKPFHKPRNQHAAPTKDRPLRGRSFQL